MIIAVATATEQNSAYRHRKYEGRFRNEGALRFYSSIGRARSKIEGNLRPQKA